MKKSILNLGKVLNKAEQKNINGAFGFEYPLGNCYQQGVNPPQLVARVPCNELCPNGGTPFCIVFDSGLRN